LDYDHRISRRWDLPSGSSALELFFRTNRGTQCPRIRFFGSLPQRQFRQL